MKALFCFSAGERLSDERMLDVFRGRLLDLDFAPGVESLDVRLFREKEIPGEQIAFPVIKETLGLYFRDRTNGGFEVRSGDIVRVDGYIRRYRVRIHARVGILRWVFAKKTPV